MKGYIQLHEKSNRIQKKWNNNHVEILIGYNVVLLI